MLVALDLSARQAARLLAQAVRTRAKLEMEPRPESHGELLWGTLAARERDLLQVDLHHTPHELRLSALVGAMCDVRTILSGQLCLFSTFIVDVSDHIVPRRITLSAPDTMQVGNRRRFARRAPTEPVPVRISPSASEPQLVAILANIGPNGLGCRVVSRDLEDMLLIGDEVRLEFALPWSADVYTIPAAVCTKIPCGEEGHLIVGFEFVTQGNEATLARLRDSLNDETARLTEMEGDL